MGKYKKRKDGRYVTSVVVNGKKKYIYGKTITEVDMKLSQIKTDSSRGMYSDDKGMTVKKWGKKWLETYKKDKSYATYYMYKNAIDKHLAPIHDIRLKDLTKTDVQECINSVSGWSLQKQIRLTISGMLDDAIEDGLLYKNVARKIKVAKKQKTKTRALTDAERRAIDKCDFTTEERCFVSLLRYTGMRPEEARALTVNDIDLIKKTINIDKTLTFRENDYELSNRTKTDAGTRTIPILDALEDDLRAFMNEVDSLYIFTNSKAELHTKATYRRFWERIYNKINEQMGGNKNIKATDLHPYVFRHEFATTLYYSGIDLKEAARIMGHADTKMILEVYAELDLNKSNSVDKLNQYIKEVAK